MKLSDLPTCLRIPAENGLPLFHVTKLVEGWNGEAAVEVTELTTADFTTKIGKRVKACAGPNYTVTACTVAHVER